MKLLVGLGNPGRRYARTRHNVGFRVVERFAEAHGIPLDESRFGGRFGRGWFAAGEEALQDVGILEPETYMNLSGDAVVASLRALRVADLQRDLLVVFDDVDLPFGRLRVRPGGGSSGHNGVAHIIERLGRSDFPRLRFGIGRSADRLDTAAWVLQPFGPEEEARLAGCVDRAAEAIETALAFGVPLAMDRYNGAGELDV